MGNETGTIKKIISGQTHRSGKTSAVPFSKNKISPNKPILLSRRLSPKSEKADPPSEFRTPRVPLATPEVPIYSNPCGRGRRALQRSAFNVLCGKDKECEKDTNSFAAGRPPLRHEMGEKAGRGGAQGSEGNSSDVGGLVAPKSDAMFPVQGESKQ